MAANLEHFTFNSDYPIDKVVYLKEIEDQFDSTGQIAPRTIDTGLGTTVYIRAVYSFDDWQTSFVLAQQFNKDLPLSYSASNDLGSFRYVFQYGWPVSSYANKKVKIRFWGVLASDDTATMATPTYRASQNPIMFNTDANYPRLAADGTTTVKTVVTHNLGVIPWVDAWVVSGGWNMYHTDGEYPKWYTIGASSAATDKTVEFGPWNTDDETNPTTKIYYRLYV